MSQYTKKQRSTLRNAVMDAMEILNCVTYQEFAKKIGVVTSTPGFWLRGQRGISMPAAQRIEALTKGKVTVLELMPDLQKYK